MDFLAELENKTQPVLISTYWNVNKEMRQCDSYEQHVLISTYWNVNA